MAGVVQQGQARQGPDLARSLLHPSVVTTPAPWALQASMDKGKRMQAAPRANSSSHRCRTASEPAGAPGGLGSSRLAALPPAAAATLHHRPPPRPQNVNGAAFTAASRTLLVYSTLQNPHESQARGGGTHTRHSRGGLHLLQGATTRGRPVLVNRRLCQLEPPCALRHIPLAPQPWRQPVIMVPTPCRVQSGGGAAGQGTSARAS